jgi:pimeloyl-ACP methyl ester carboxylesterase
MSPEQFDAPANDLDTRSDACARGGGARRVSGPGEGLMHRLHPLVQVFSLALIVLPFPCVCGASPGGPAKRPFGHHAAVNGIRIYYEDRGHGPALFLLHGGAGNGMQFDKQAPFFARHFRVIVPDACAQGRTTDRPDSLTYHAMAEDVIGLMNHLKIGRADILGWSDGGVTGLDLALNHPHRIDHLVTFGANFRADGLNAADIAWNRTASADSFGPDMERAYREIAPDPDHYRVSMNRVIALWRDQPNFTTEELGRIRARVLIAAGEHDVVRRDHTEELAKAIPGARLWIVPGGSHSVMQEQPDLVNRTVLRFLTEGGRE